MGYNETAGVSGWWSLIRDLTEPFRPQFLSVLRFAICLDILLCHYNVTGALAVY